jgi:hypothetical protein
MAEQWGSGYAGNPGERIHIAVTYVDQLPYEQYGRTRVTNATQSRINGSGSNH